MMPTIGRSSWNSAIRVPKVGRPVMKARVPSIGSSTQRNAALRPLEAEFLAQNAVVGKPFGQDGAHRLLGGAVGDGDRGAVGLLVGDDTRPEEGTDHRARDVRRRTGGGDQRVGVRDHFVAGAGARARPRAGVAAAGAAGAGPGWQPPGRRAGAAAAAGNGTGFGDSVRR